MFAKKERKIKETNYMRKSGRGGQNAESKRKAKRRREIKQTEGENTEKIVLWSEAYLMGWLDTADMMASSIQNPPALLGP